MRNLAFPWHLALHLMRLRKTVLTGAMKRQHADPDLPHAPGPAPDTPKKNCANRRK